MSKPFDATTKYLMETHPRDLLDYIGLSAIEDYEVEAIDADLSTVTADADKILRVGGPEPFLAHVEAQSGPDSTVDERTLHYNVLMGWRHKLPVLSVLLLLRPEADSPRLTGNLQKRLPDGRNYLNFSYLVVRVWEKSVEDVLAGGLGALPLAPLSNVSLDELPDVIERMKARIEAETTPQDAGLLWTATNVLMGLRYPKTVAENLLKGVKEMEESVTYQAIVEKGRQKGLQEGEQKGRQEGRIEEARQMVYLFGTARLGNLDEATRARIEALTTREDIESLAQRVTAVENWSELFTV